MEEIARDDSVRGEVVLLRRNDGSLVLRVNGVFVMASDESASERRLAAATLDEHPGDNLHVVVGGLGLGFTLDAVLDDPRVRQATVIEIEPCLVRWHRDGVIGTGSIADPRVTLVVGDIRSRLSSLSAVDVLLLDVDNGPDFLVYDANRAVYEPGFLNECAEVLRTDGTIAIWSASAAPDLVEAMRHAFANVRTIDIPVRLGERAESYHVLLGQRRS